MGRKVELPFPKVCIPLPSRYCVGEGRIAPFADMLACHQGPAHRGRVRPQLSAEGHVTSHGPQDRVHSNVLGEEKSADTWESFRTENRTNSCTLYALTSTHLENLFRMTVCMLASATVETAGSLTRFKASRIVGVATGRRVTSAGVRGLGITCSSPPWMKTCRAWQLRNSWRKCIQEVRHSPQTKTAQSVIFYNSFP